MNFEIIEFLNDKELTELYNELAMDGNIEFKAYCKCRHDNSVDYTSSFEEFGFPDYGGCGSHHLNYDNCMEWCINHGFDYIEYFRPDCFCNKIGYYVYSVSSIVQCIRR